MAKVLRMIVNLILLLFILTGAALLVPPLVGVTTAVAEGDMVTNLQTGSVVYAWRTSLTELKSGDKILQTESDSVYVYEVAGVNTTDNTVTVTASGDSQTQELSLGRTAQKVVVTLPLIGYMSIAMQTMEGRIILGLVALLLIVLFVLTEVWCRRREDEEDETEETSEEEDDQYFKTLAEHQQTSGFPGRVGSQPIQTASASANESSVSGDTRIFPGTSSSQGKESADDFAEDFARDAAEEPIEEVTEDIGEDFIEDFPEDRIGDPAEDQGEEIRNQLAEELADDPAGTSSADGAAGAKAAESEAEVFIKNIAGSGNQEGSRGQAGGRPSAAETEQAPDTRMAASRDIKTDTIPDVQAALEAALEQQQIRTHEAAPVQEVPQEETEPLPMEELELAMPVKTVEEYLQEAYAAGEDPVVSEDKTTGVNFVDFSECL